MDPILGLTIAGTAISALGTIQQAQSQAAASRFNQQVAQRNQLLAQQRAEEQADRGRREARRFLGAQRAAVGASGLALEGSPMDVLADTASELELDIQTARHAALIDAMSFGGAAGLEGSAAANARAQGFLGVGSDVLTGGLAGLRRHEELTRRLGEGQLPGANVPGGFPRRNPLRLR